MIDVVERIKINWNGDCVNRFKWMYLLYRIVRLGIYIIVYNNCKSRICI